MKLRSVPGTDTDALLILHVRTVGSSQTLVKVEIDVVVLCLTLIFPRSRLHSFFFLKTGISEFLATKTI